MNGCPRRGGSRPFRRLRLMTERRIDKPIINSPFEMPDRHFRFDDDGITDGIVEGRRPSAYFMPIPASKRWRR